MVTNTSRRPMHNQCSYGGPQRRPNTTGSLMQRLQRNEKPVMTLKRGNTRKILDSSTEMNSHHGRRKHAFSNSYSDSLRYDNNSPTKMSQDSNKSTVKGIFTMLTARRRARAVAMASRGWKARTEAEPEDDVPKIEKFRAAAKKVRLLIHVFNQIRRYAAEKGGHAKLISGMAMQLKDAVNETDVQKDLLFDPTMFQCRYQAQMPSWAKKIGQKHPYKRTHAEIELVAGLMRQLTCFRKYTKKMQHLLAKVSRFESFGRRRVVIRKGHIGTSFYIIFSGQVAVVIDEDEDKAFVEGEKPANTMTRGEAFGELALVRRTVRSATVVCLEKTEFLVIDKGDFFDAGIDKCVEEEMSTRVGFLGSLHLLSTWNEGTLRKVAEEARIRECFSDKVIVKDSTDSEFIYFVLKGQCNVLRMLDLSSMAGKYLVSNSSSKVSSRYCNSRATATESDNASFIDYESSDQEADKMKQSKINARDQNTLIKEKVIRNWKLRKRENSSSSNSFKMPNGHTKSLLKSVPNSNGSTRQSHTNDQMPIVKSVVEFETSAPSLKHFNKAGLGVLMKVATLGERQCFGLSSVLDEAEKDTDDRKFILLSAGCEVIAISREAFKNLIDEATLAKIRETLTTYPSDEELYTAFISQSGWRSYREKLTDNLIAAKAQRKMTARSPNTDPETNRYDRGRRKWRRLVETGLTNAFKKRPTGTKSPVCSPQNRRQTQEQSLHGNRRTLVLTHGGSRINSAQRSTNCALTKQH